MRARRRPRATRGPLVPRREVVAAVGTQARQCCSWCRAADEAAAARAWPQRSRCRRKKPRKVRVGWPSARRLSHCCAHGAHGSDETQPRAIGEAWDTAAGAGTLPQGKGTKRGSEVRRASAHLMRRRRRRRSTRLRALTIAQKNLRARGHGSRGVGGEPCGREEAQQPGL